MATEPKTQSWWQTLPGILTALAGVLSAVTGLVVALHQTGVLAEKGAEKAASSVAGPPAATQLPPPPASPGGSPVAPAAGEPPFFMQRLVSEADLAGRNAWELDVMRNEIYARHGRRFSRADLQAHFDRQPWYQPRYAPDAFPDALLSDAQRANVAFIAAYRRRLGG